MNAVIDVWYNLQTQEHDINCIYLEVNRRKLVKKLVTYFSLFS